MAFPLGKKHFVRILLFLTIFVCLGIVAEEARQNGTKLATIRRRNRLSTTEISIDETTAMPLPYRKISEKFKNDLDRKIDELLSTRTKCGVLAVNTTVPWIVVIEHTDPTGKNKRKTVSKGVLIGEQHVLTTVSSIHNSYPFWVVSSVRLGDPITWITETSQRNDSSYVRIDIDHVYQHSSKDIAIIKLARKVEFTEYIQPACLPIDDNYNFREMYFHICKRGKNRKFDVKLLSSMPLAPQDCETLFHRKGAQFGSTDFCAWDEFGDSCLSDVGGPLMAHFNGRFIVVGLNSYVFTTDEFEANEYPGVYVKVGAFQNWINSILSL